MDVLGAVATIGGSLISGIFGSKASKEAAGASTAAAAMQIEAAKEMQEKELEAQREALEMLKESEQKSIDIMIDSMLNQFRLGKQDYLQQQQAKAGLAALTYGKPQEYISNIWTTAQSRGMEVPTEVVEATTERTEIAPAREEVSYTKTAAAAPGGIPQNRMNYLQNQFSRINYLQPKTYAQPGQAQGSLTPSVRVTRIGDAVSVGVTNVKKPYSFEITLEEAKALGVDPTGKTAPGKYYALTKRFDKDTLVMPVKQFDSIWQEYLSKAPEPTTAAAEGTTKTEGPPVTEDEVARAQQRTTEGYRGSELPAVETETGELSPEELVSQVYESPMYKQRLFETEEALKGIMGRDIYSSAGRKLYAREVSKAGVQEEERLWNRLSQLAGYGSYLPETVSAAGQSIAGYTSAGGSQAAQTIISGARSGSDIMMQATGRAGGYTAQAGQYRAQGTQAIGSAIGYGLEDYFRSRQLEQLFGAQNTTTPASSGTKYYEPVYV